MTDKSDLPGIVVTGVSGRMGRTLVRAIAASDRMRLVGAVERPGHDWIGADLGQAMGGAATGLNVTDDPLEAFASAQAVIDFTAPDATVAFAALAAQARAVHVIGTTGLDAGHLARLKAAARHAVIVRAGNMSLGVNLLAVLVEQAARALEAGDFDIEVLEMHHRHKVDAPSGTALLLGEAAARGRQIALKDKSVRVRDGHTGAREEGTIGFATLRGGSIVGDHSVILAGPGERITLSHHAEDRSIFARGAVKAALWAHGRKPGLYTMQDVLGLTGT